MRTITNAVVRTGFACLCCDGRGCKECNAGVRHRLSTNELCAMVSTEPYEPRQHLLLTVALYALREEQTLVEILKILATEIQDALFVLHGFSPTTKYGSLRIQLWNLLVADSQAGITDVR